MKKIIFPIIVLMLFIAVPIAHAGFLDKLIAVFTGNAVFENVEYDCKRNVAVNEGETNTFLFNNQNQKLTFDSVLREGGARLVVNGVPYDFKINERKHINDKMSITLYKVANVGSFQGPINVANLIFSKEGDKCSCVGNSISLQKGIVNRVSDGMNFFNVEFADYLFDNSLKSNSYVVYSVDGFKSGKTYNGETAVIAELSGLKIKTKNMDANGVEVLIDNSGNCNLALPTKEETIVVKNAAGNTLLIGTVRLQQISETEGVKEFSLNIPPGTGDKIFILTPEGKFDLKGNKIAEEMPVAVKEAPKKKCIFF